MCRPLVWSRMHTGRSCDTCRAAVPVPVLLQLHPECVDGAHPQQAVAARDGATASPLAGLPPFSPPSCHPPACPAAAAAPTCIHVHMWRDSVVWPRGTIVRGNLNSPDKKCMISPWQKPPQDLSLFRKELRKSKERKQITYAVNIEISPTEFFLKYKGNSTSAQFHW